MEQFEISDYYERLGVSPAATAQDIKTAYRKMAMQCHPDADKDNPNAHKNFIAVSQAFETLSNPARRAVYDRTRLEPVAPPFHRQPSTSQPTEERQNEEEAFRFYDEFYKKHKKYSEDIFNLEDYIIKNKIKKNFNESEYIKENLEDIILKN